MAASGVVADAQAWERTLGGMTVLPPRVVDIEGTRDGSNNLTVTFERQTRRRLQFLDQAVSLDEDEEEYEVQAYDGSDVVRRETVTTRSWSYTAAEQTTDGLTPGNDVDIDIKPKSKIGHWGRSRSATV